MVNGMISIPKQSRHRIPNHENPNSINIDKVVNVGKEYQTIDEQGQKCLKSNHTSFTSQHRSLSNQELRSQPPNSSFFGHVCFYIRCLQLKKLCYLINLRLFLQTTKWYIIRNWQTNPIRILLQSGYKLIIRKGEKMINRVIKLHKSLKNPFFHFGLQDRD